MSIKIQKINLIKILLDVVMAVLLILMYNSKVISLNFHEIGGIFVCGLFLIHKLINWKWIAAVSKKLISKNLNFKLRLGYIIDFLLLISMTAILVSGIFISKIVFRGFSFNGSNIWKTVHYSVSALSLILAGIHLGLHWGFVMGMFKKYVKIPSIIAKQLSIILVVAIVAFGSYSMVTSSFTRWLTMPFTTSQAGGFEGKQPPADFNPGQSDGDSNSTSPDQNVPSDNSAAASSSITGTSMSTKSNTDNNSANGSNVQDSQQNQDQARPSRPEGSRPEGGDFKGRGKGQFGEGMPGGAGFEEQPGASGIGNIILTFGSIIGLFAAVTFYLEKLFKLKSRKKLLPQNI